MCHNNKIKLIDDEPELRFQHTQEDMSFNHAFNATGSNSSPSLKTYARKFEDFDSIEELKTIHLGMPRISSFASTGSCESQISERILEMECDTEAALAKKCKAFTYKIKSLKKKLKARQSQTYRLNKKKTSFSVSAVLNNLYMFKSQSVKTFINMQLFHKKGCKWSKQEKQLALSLHYKSPAAYKFMMYNLKFNLPSIRTIQTWLKVSNLRTGLKTNLIKKLHIKASSMTEREKMCVVLFDEIALKKKLELNHAEDIIEGYHDLGSLGRATNFANTGLVFMIRGLLHNWKIPLCYFVSAGAVNSSSLQQIIRLVIKKLQDMSFKPTVLVCDQGSNNRSALALLGASKEQPTIEIEGQKIFTCFDAPHLLKSIRNNFMNTKLLFVINKRPVAWTDVAKTFEIDQKSATTRAMLKITSNHITPTNFQKMRVKLAAQIFSHTVGSAIKTAAATKQWNSSTSLNTADFIENMNNIFDSLNSRVLHDPNPNRRPLSIYKKRSEEVLQNGLEYFKNIEVFEANKQRNNIYCLNGFEWTLRSILLLWDHLKELGVKYLLTGFLNQDPLENFFSVIRNRGGYNPTPTVRQFRLEIQHNMNIRLQMAVNTGNCEVEESEALGMDVHQSNSAESSTSIQIRNDEDGNTGDNVNEEESLNEDLENVTQCVRPIQNNTLEKCSNVYVAGYLAHSVEKKFHCQVCSGKLTQGESNLIHKNEFFLLAKDYSRGNNIQFLKRPSEEFANIVTYLLLQFNEAFHKYKCGASFTRNIKRSLKMALQDEYCDWFSFEENQSCLAHKEHIIDLLIKMKTFHQLKWESQAHIAHSKAKLNKSIKPHRKVRILSGVNT